MLRLIVILIKSCPKINIHSIFLLLIIFSLSIFKWQLLIFNFISKFLEFITEKEFETIESISSL